MTNQENNPPPGGPAGAVETAPKPKAESRWPARDTAILLVVVLAVGVIGFVAFRHHEKEEAAPAAITPVVAVAKVEREDLYNEVTFSAEFRPFVEVELNAKVSGYVTNLNVDFGDKVKKGQLLATLEVPELADELDSAKAAEKRAEADYEDAHLIHTRLTAVNQEKPNLVAQQDIDTAAAKDSVAAAAVTAAKADVGKYETLFGYTQIIAPFDGVITGRFADPGALIQAGTGSGTQVKALLRVSDNYRLRLDFPVEIAYVKDIHLGDKVAVRVQSLNDKVYEGEVTRFTDRVNVDTRTMITEIEVPNPNLELVPGMYAKAGLKVERRNQALAIPIEALSMGKTNTVYLVNSDQKIEERGVTIGLETPTRCEVISGLKEGDQVMIGGRTQTPVGQKVETKAWQAPTME